MNDHGPHLGELVAFDRPRDAVHIAVIPLVAAEELHPGWMVNVDEAGYAYKVADQYRSIGVVDPFIYGVVEKGQRFWALLRPGSVTGMRHQWTSADFPEMGVPATAEARSASVNWLVSFAGDKVISYEAMVEGAISGEGATFGVDCHGTIAREFGEDVAQLFWDHMEVVTGRKFTVSHRTGTPFSCSC